MKTLWLVIYYGRGDYSRGTSHILRESASGQDDEIPENAHEIYSTQHAALAAVASTLRDWIDEIKERGLALKEIAPVDRALTQERIGEAIKLWNHYIITVSDFTHPAFVEDMQDACFPIELHEVPSLEGVPS